MTNVADVFKKIVRKAVATSTLAVRFSPDIKGPRYLPKEQTGRRDGKAVIEFPCQENRMIDQNATDAELEKIFVLATEEALVVFSHEYGHHLTKNPGYDEALKRCLTLPVSERARADIDLVIKEETEAWSLGFAELKLLGFETPKWAHQLASKSVQEYRDGVISAEPKKPSH